MNADEALALTPRYRLDWSDEDCVWSVAPNWRPHLVDAEFAYGVHRTQPLSFEIVAPSTRLDGLWIRLATYRRSNTAHLWFELKALSGEVLTRAYLDPAAVRDGLFHQVMDLRAVELRKGAKYRVEVTGPTGSDEDAFGVWVVRSPAGRYELRPQLERFRNERLFVYGDVDGRLTAASSVEAVLVALEPFGARTGRLFGLLSELFPAQTFQVAAVAPVAALWPVLSQADVVLFTEPVDLQPSGPEGFEALCFALRRRGVATVFLDDLAWPAALHSTRFVQTPELAAREDSRLQTQRRCQYLLNASDRTLAHSDRPHLDLFEALVLQSGQAPALAALVKAARAGRAPRVAIVSVLYNKAQVIERFIARVIGQTYPGPIDLVLVDDRSPQADASRAREAALGLELAKVENRSITVVDNPRNLGNCASRLIGIGTVEADIYVIIDCDCLINRDFVAAHVFEHARADVDAVTGPSNIESQDQDPSVLLAQLEAAPGQAWLRSEPQDPIQPDGFLNCITRNFSITRAAALAEPVFDLDFSYSAKPGSGFGWEDVEMGYRLYTRGAVIRFTPHAFAVHISHPASTSETAKVAGSMRNFERLFVKHPELALVARRWAADAYDRISEWARHHHVDGGAPQRALENRFAPLLEARRGLVNAYRPGHRRLRILSCRWHVPHQYELYKLPHDFTLATHVGGSGMGTSWRFDQRPLRDNVSFAAADSIDPADYDLAILHFDENVLAPYLCNGIIPASWGDGFRWLLGLPGLPKIAVCHGTPQFVGQYGADPNPIRDFVVYEAERLRLVEALASAGVKVVCNAWQALEEWGFHDSRVIWHGFDPQQFPAGRRDLDVLALEPDRRRPHYRGAWVHDEVVARLDPGIGVGAARHAGAALERRDSNAFAVRSFRAYADRIGRFSFYLNTTLRSPMPRSRGEAMMTGAIPVSLNNYDVERFVQNGVDGFYADEPEALADWINFVHRHPHRKAQIAQAARRTALDLFNHDRFLSEWIELIKDVGP